LGIAINQAAKQESMRSIAMHQGAGISAGAVSLSV